MKGLIQTAVEGAIVIGIILVCLSVKGCMTINGFGQDLQRVTDPYVEGQP